MASSQQQTAQPLLDAGPLPVQAIRDQARKHLVDALDSRRGKKVLVLDPRISGPLGLVAEVQLLKEHGVEQLIHLSPEAVTSEVRNVLYLVRPTLQNAQLVSKQVKATLEAGLRQPGGSQMEHSVFFVPRRTAACNRIFEEEGILGDVTIGEFPLDLIAFESDILSLELGSAFRETVLEGDPSSLFYVARALVKLEALVGTIPRVIGKGSAAAAVSDLLQRLRREVALAGPADSAPDGPRAEVDGLIILDRRVDLVTPMCTQLTYEGLIDEVLGIHNGTVEMDGGNPAAVAGVKRNRIPLNSSDNLFKGLRDLNFAAVGPTLRRRALELQSDYQDLSPDSKTVSQMKDFVKKLNSLPELNRHTSIADTLSQATRKTEFTAKLKVEQSLLDGYSVDAVADQLEDMMYQMEDPWVVLRLLCIASLIQGGLPPKRFDSLRREFLLSYGHEQILLLNALQRAKLLCKQDGTKPVFANLKAKLNLIVDDISESDPKDIAYTFSGYAPLSCRLVEAAIQTGWGKAEDVMKLIPGPKVDYTQAWDERGVPVAKPADGELLPPTSSSAPGRRRTVLVTFIGGVTYGEIASLRFIGKQHGIHVVIVTTQLINGSTLLETFLPDVLQLAAKRKQMLAPV